MADTLDLADIQGLVARGYSEPRHARFTIFASLTTSRPARALLELAAPAGHDRGACSPRIPPLQVAFTAVRPARARPAGPGGGRVLGWSSSRAWPPRTGAGSWATRKSPTRAAGPGAGRTGRRSTASSCCTPAARSCSTSGRRNSGQQLARAASRRHRPSWTPCERRRPEPFGFHDGISQPRHRRACRRPPGPSGPVPAGEFVLGYPNGYGQLTDRPLLPRSDDPGRLLPPDPAGSGAADLGRNGTYLVLRQLEQDVEGFWRYVGRGHPAAGRLRRSPARRTALAAKLVGRWPSGAPLVKAPDRDDPALADDNDFGYHHADPLGLACPLGAHIRRANPRDSLDPQPGTDASLRGQRPAPAAAPRAQLRPGRATAHRTAASRAVLHLPGRQPGQAVRVRPAHLAEQPDLQRPVRRRGPAGREPPRRRRRPSPCRRARCAAATAACRSSCGPGAAPTSSCPASPPCATCSSCRRPSLPDPERGDRMATRRPPAYHQSAFWRLYDRVAELLDHKVGWDRLPVPLGLVALVGLRDVLRTRNLYDTSDVPAVNLPPVAPATPEVRTTRTRRRHLQRPGRAPDGDGRVPVRPQRAARRAPTPTRRRTSCSPARAR